jgi:uncharacterized protein involved in exopolysaccharide biosynthesis
MPPIDPPSRPLAFSDVRTIFFSRYKIFLIILFACLVLGFAYARSTHTIYRLEMMVMPTPQYTFSTLKGATNQEPHWSPLGRILYHMKSQDFIASISGKPELIALLPPPPSSQTLLQRALNIPPPTMEELQIATIRKFIHRLRLLPDPLYEGYYIQIDDKNPEHARKVLRYLYQEAEQYFGSKMVASNTRLNENILLELVNLPPDARPLLLEAYAYNLLQINTFQAQGGYFGTVVSNPVTPVYIWPNVPLILGISAVIGMSIALLVIFSLGQRSPKQKK